jgi:hypothetical protein
MSVLMACASGLWTDATTWALVDATSYLNAENATESLLTTTYSNTRSSAFTPGAITIDGIAVKLCERLGTTGTMSVHLINSASSIEVAGTEVTINVADLPSALEASLDGGWIFFKFASPVTLAGATAYRIEAKTSSANMVDLWCDSTADNLSRCLRTTTTQDAVAGDDLIITGEKTGAGAETAITVTMDETASTDYGSASTSLVTPALAICDGGTLTWGTTGATNYLLRLSGNLIVYSGGTYSQGTTGTPIPRGSTAWLEFDCATDGDFGFTARNGSTVNGQFLSRTSGKDIVSCKLNTDEAANSTSLGVDTDTGWLDNDEIAIAPTAKTATHYEAGTLNGNAGASTLTVDGFAGAGGGIANPHLGTSPYFAEVILLTRSGGIRAVTSTAVTYITIRATAIVDFDWMEFRYLATSTTDKRGIQVDTTTGSFAMNYCCVRNTENCALFVQGTLSGGGSFNLSNTNFYLINTASASGIDGITLQSNCNSTNAVVNNIILMGATASNLSNARIMTLSTNFNASMDGITMTGCTGSGTNTSLAIICNNAVINNLITHSNACFGFIYFGVSGKTKINNLECWRNTATSGIAIGDINAVSTQMSQLEIDGGFIYANSSGNIRIYAALTLLVLKNLNIGADSSFATSTGIEGHSNAFGGKILCVNCDFGTPTAHTSDVQSSIPYSIDFINCMFRSATEYNAPTMDNIVFNSHKHDQNSASFLSKSKYRTVTSETTTRHTASGYAWKVTPSSASYKAIIPGPSEHFNNFKRFVGSGQTVTINAWVQKDGSYNGNAPRLVMVGGIVPGIASDVVDSLTVGASTWEELTVSGTASEDGWVEFYLDGDGTAGNFFVDDISYTLA